MNSPSPAHARISVIGADGAFSRVRPAVSPAVPQYMGISFLEARFEDVDNRHPDPAALVGRGGAATVEDAVLAYEKTVLPRSVEMATALEGGTEHLLSADTHP